MEEKLSDALASLAARTKNIEDKVAAARQESKEKLDKMIADSKKELKARKETFVNHTEELNAKAKGDWGSFKESLKQRAEHIKADTDTKKKHLKEKIDEKKHDWDVTLAENYYNDSIDYTISCIEWASLALTEVENATLEAYSAKLQLDALKQK